MSQHRMRAGVAAAVAVTSLAAAAPAGADPNPAQRERSAALAREQSYTTHKPADAEPGFKLERRYDGRDLRTVRVPDAAGASGAADTRVTAPAPAQPAGSSGFEWGDAAIGSGATLGLVLVLAGGAAVISRRQRPATS